MPFAPFLEGLQAFLCMCAGLGRSRLGFDSNYACVAYLPLHPLTSPPVDCVDNPMDFIQVPDQHIAQIRISVGAADGQEEWRTIQMQQQQAAASEWAYLAELRAAAGADPGAGSAASGAESSSRGGYAGPRVIVSPRMTLTNAL